MPDNTIQDSFQHNAQQGFQQSSPNSFNSHRFCIAPMIDWTDRHCRYFHRQLSQHALLYTEMVTTGAILHGDRERHLKHNLADSPVALQLGGADPEALYQSCKIAEAYRYSEYNLNIGCPSDRVQSGRFGACLMKEPEQVKDCLIAMQEATELEVSAKCRTGVDDFDSFDFLVQFIETVKESGCRTFIIHARKAWLSGLSPKENREIPPLHYERVHKIKQLFPELNIVINGGIEDLQQSQNQLQTLDGVMLGRAAYNRPWLLHEVDEKIFDEPANSLSRLNIIENMLPYIEQELQAGSRLHHITRHMLGLFNGEKGAKQFRRYLSENANNTEAGPEVLLRACKFIQTD